MNDRLALTQRIMDEIRWADMSLEHRLAEISKQTGSRMAELGKVIAEQFRVDAL